jgi:uncharacterized protein DUF3106
VRRALCVTTLIFGMVVGGFAQQESPPPDDQTKPRLKAPLTEEQRTQLEQRLDATWSKMPLEAKQRLIRLHRALAEMPPDERKFIHDRIERFLTMTPAERKTLQQNNQKWDQMTPEEREKAREEFRRHRAELEGKWQHEHPGEESPTNGVATPPITP